MANEQNNPSTTVDHAAVKEAAHEARRNEDRKIEAADHFAARTLGYSLSFSLVAGGIAALATAYVAITKE